MKAEISGVLPTTQILYLTQPIWNPLLCWQPAETLCIAQVPGKLLPRKRKACTGVQNEVETRRREKQEYSAWELWGDRVIEKQEKWGNWTGGRQLSCKGTQACKWRREWAGYSIIKQLLPFSQHFATCLGELHLRFIKQGLWREAKAAPGSLLAAPLLKFSPSLLIFCLYYRIIESHIHLSLKD